MSQFKEIDAALAARAKGFDKDLQMGPALPEVEAELFAALTRDLPAAPASWFSNQITALVAKPAEAADLVRALLVERMQAIGEAAGVMLTDTEATADGEWSFDQETGAPLIEQPIPNVNLAKALVAAGRGQRVHPLCVRAGDADRCNCPEHSLVCRGGKPRLANFKKGATTKPSQLFAWWAKWPDADVGIAGGGGNGANRAKRDAARLFLAEMLNDQWVPANTVLAEAKERGFSESTIERAAKEIGIEKEQVAGGMRSWWEWRWPLDKQPDPSAVNDDARTVELLRQFVAAGQGQL